MNFSFRVLAFFVFTLFYSCEQSDNLLETNDGTITGSWRLIEVLMSNGGANPQWKEVEDGHIYNFKKNGNFYSNRFEECSTGSYLLEEGHLILNFDCENFTSGLESPEGSFKEDIRFETGLMILSPTYLTCIEGCSFKFERIN